MNDLTKLGADIVLTPEQLRVAAILRAERAMSLIEDAQHLLASACAELSGLQGGVTVWRACSKMTDRVHTFWYQVQRFRINGKYRLDSISIESLKKHIATDRLKAAQSAQGSIS